MKIFLMVLVFLYLMIQIATSFYYTPYEMRRFFWKRECFAGKFLVTVFYLPAWFLKLFKLLVMWLIR